MELRPAGTMTGLRGNSLDWDRKERVTPAERIYRTVEIRREADIKIDDRARRTLGQCRRKSLRRPKMSNNQIEFRARASAGIRRQLQVCAGTGCVYSAGPTTVAACILSERRCLERTAKGHGRPKVLRRHWVKLPVNLLLNLIGRLVRILAQAGLIHIAAVHANVAVDDLHSACPSQFECYG